MNTVKKEEASMTGGEMLDRSSSWTLACDNALLNRLKSFSEDLTRNSQQISKECDNLSRDISKLDYRLMNVTNEFLMLSNTQFVENRVEEFEEFSASLSPSVSNVTTSKTKAEKEEELISKMKQAIQLGLAACNNKRQQRQNGQSGNRFATTRPYLIGSPKFFSSKYCGLVDESVRIVPSYDNYPEADSISLDQSQISNSSSQVSKPMAETNPAAGSQVQFTMPPPPAFSVVLSDKNTPRQITSAEVQNDNSDSYYQGQVGANVVPPSPTISDRNSDMSKSSVSASRENVPRSVTDELNRIYKSYVPPPNMEDDSDDDFRPSAAAGRLFADDDDDIFGEKELFPSASRKTADFFGRSNPSTNITAPVFSVPPPVNPVPHQPTFSQVPPFYDVQTLAGSKPRQDANEVPSMKSGSDDSVSKEDVVINDEKKIRSEPVPETEGPVFRSKLPPGAVSMFGGLPPPVFNNGTLQPAQTASTAKASSFPSKDDTQINAALATAPQAVINSESSTAVQVSKDKNNGKQAFSSQKQDDVNQPKSIITSQPPLADSRPGRRDNISQGSLIGSGNVNRLSQKVPTSSLFADDSSDDDIFVSNKKQQSKKVNVTAANKADDIIHPNTVTSSSVTQRPIAPSASSVNTLTGTTSASKRDEGKPTKHTTVKKSIFDDSDSDEDLFSSKPFPSTSRSDNKGANVVKKDSIFKSEPKKAVLKVKSKGSSLFGDDSDSDTDLFGNKKGSNVKRVIAPVPSSGSEISKPDSYSKTLKMGDVASNVAVADNHEELFKDDNKTEVQVLKKQNSEELPVCSSKNNDEEDPPKSEGVNDDGEIENVTVTIKIKPKSPIISRNDIVNETETRGKSQTKKSIFDDESDDDDLFKSVTIKLPKKPVETKSTNDNNDNPKTIEPPVSKKQDVRNLKKGSSLFDDESDSDSDLFSSKSKSTTKSKSSSPKLSLPQSPVKEQSPEKQICDEVVKPSTFDEVDATNLDKDNNSSAESRKQSIEDASKNENAATKPVGNKISEKIKAMQSGSSEKTEESPSKKPIKSKVSVKNLALNLNINPLALKVGAKPPKLGSASNPSTPVTDDSPSVSSSTNDNSLNSGEDKVTPFNFLKSSLSNDVEEILPIDKNSGMENGANYPDEDESPSTSSNFLFNDGQDHFVDIIKARAKIQRKRRPPTKRFLRSLATQDEQKDTDCEANETKEPTDDAT